MVTAPAAAQQERRAAGAEQTDDQDEYCYPADRHRSRGFGVLTGKERATLGADELVVGDPATARTGGHLAHTVARPAPTVCSTRDGVVRSDQLLQQRLA